MALHEEVQKIYKTYCLDESIDKIRFDPFIVEEIQRSKFEFGRNDVTLKVRQDLTGLIYLHVISVVCCGC